MDRQLTSRGYWNRYWQNSSTSSSSPFWRRSKDRIRALVGADRLEYLARTYSDYVLWEGIYRRFFTKNSEGKPRLSVIEIGSAPGEYLIRLKTAFGVQPFGVEYAEEGVERNKKLFKREGIPESNVIFSDAFAPAFLAAHRDRYDVVVSRGVIEHFTDPSTVIDAHIDVLKPGGLLIVSVPNYRWLNWLLKRTFDGHSLPGHNLEIMKPEVFRNAFAGRGLEELHCAPYGSIDLSVSQPETRGGILWALYMICEKAQLPMNALLRMAFGTKAPNTRFTSPFLIYIGRKAA